MAVLGFEATEELSPSHPPLCLYEKRDEIEKEDKYVKNEKCNKFFHFSLLFKMVKT